MQLPYFIYTRLTSNIPRWNSWAETSRWKNSNLLRKNQRNSTTQLCKILLQPLELQILWANAWRITNPASSRPIIEICVCGQFVPSLFFHICTACFGRKAIAYLSSGHALGDLIRHIHEKNGSWSALMRAGLKPTGLFSEASLGCNHRLCVRLQNCMRDAWRILQWQDCAISGFSGWTSVSNFWSIHGRWIALAWQVKACCYSFVTQGSHMVFPANNPAVVCVCRKCGHCLERCQHTCPNYFTRQNQTEIIVL